MATLAPVAENQSASPFRVFTSPKYCLYFGGQLISQSGTWMQMVALSWLAYRLTGSAFLLASVGLSSQLPSLLIMPFAGVIVDRFNRHKVVLFTQVAAMLQAGVLAYLALTHQVQIWHLIALGVWSGIATGFDMPSRSAFVVSLVESKEDLAPAIAMNSTLMNVTRLIGPALAGFIVSAFGEGVCFLINALSYIAVIGALLMIRGNFNPQPREKASVLLELKAGIQYVKETPPVRALLLMLAFFSLGGMAYTLLMPVFVKEIGGNANTLGYLMSASAVGSIMGTMLLARRKAILGLGRWIKYAAFGFSAGLLGFSFTHSFWPAAVSLVAMGFAMMILVAASNTVIQAIVDEDKRGRVMSLFSMAFMGTAPIGGLACGALANHIGFNNTILCCAIYALTVSLIWARQLPALRTDSRPLYVKKGLLAAEEEMPALMRD